MMPKAKKKTLNLSHLIGSARWKLNEEEYAESMLECSWRSEVWEGNTELINRLGIELKE